VNVNERGIVFSMKPRGGSDLAFVMYATEEGSDVKLSIEVSSQISPQTHPDQTQPQKHRSPAANRGRNPTTQKCHHLEQPKEPLELTRAQKKGGLVGMKNGLNSKADQMIRSARRHSARPSTTRNSLRLPLFIITEDDPTQADGEEEKNHMEQPYED
jgi:hypothetical protein